MPALSFRLSQEDLSRLRPQPVAAPAPPLPSPFACAPTVALPRPQPLLRARFPPPPQQQQLRLLPVAPTAGLVLKQRCDDKDGFDSWTVPVKEGESRLWTLCCAVVCRRPYDRADGLLLHERGHLETASALTHLWAAFAFVGYTLVRAFMIDLGTTRGALLVLAGGFGSLTFFTSAFYHTVSPDAELAKIGRQLDFVSIYVGVSVAFVADLCIVTREFSNVPIVAILDLPLAATLVAGFFAYRRYVLPGEATLVSEFDCSRVGMYRQWHSDLDSTAVRQASTLAMALFAFVLTPALFRNLPSAPAVVTLQAVSFVSVLGGMLLDSVFQWPDVSMQKGSWAVFPRFGCVVSAHSLWHVAALAAGVLSVAAREVAFAEV